MESDEARAQRLQLFARRLALAEFLERHKQRAPFVGGHERTHETHEEEAHVRDRECSGEGAARENSSLSPKRRPLPLGGGALPLYSVFSCASFSGISSPPSVSYRKSHPLPYPPLTWGGSSLCVPHVSRSVDALTHCVLHSHRAVQC
jgi:hypothetical protein